MKERMKKHCITKILLSSTKVRSLHKVKKQDLFHLDPFQMFRYSFWKTQFGKQATDMYLYTIMILLKAT